MNFELWMSHDDPLITWQTLSYKICVPCFLSTKMLHMYMYMLYTTLEFPLFRLKQYNSYPACNLYFYLQENLKQLDGIFSPSGIGKTTSVVFTLQNRVGNLANALKIFQVKNSNTSPPHILYLYQNSKDIEHNLGYIQCLFPTLLKSNSLY